MRKSTGSELAGGRCGRWPTVLVGFLSLPVLASSAWGGIQDGGWFRLHSDHDTAITGFTPQGVLTWSNSVVSGTVTVQCVSAASSNWSDYAQAPATNTTQSLRLFGLQPSAEYMVIDLSGGTSAASYQVSYLSAVPTGGWTDEHKTTRLVLRRIPATSPDFTMGSPPGELGQDGDETQHQVTLTKDFYIGVFEVTQRQWELVTGNRPSYFTNSAYYATRPVEQVSYYEIREDPANSDDPAAYWPANTVVNTNSFVGKLREKTGLTSLDLPTESQWEYACRAGTVTALNSGKNLLSTTACQNTAEVGRFWYNGGSGYSQGCATDTGAAAVGSYSANQWGLYDMHGNVWERCLDWYDAYPATVTNPPGGASGTSRVRRGGSWSNVARRCRSADRDVDSSAYRGNSIGFRLARTMP